MYQQQEPQPRDEREWRQNPPGIEYEAGYAGIPPQQTNELADAIARRLQAQAPSSLQTPAFHAQRNPFMISAGQRLALAIISVIALIPLAGIALGILQGMGVIPLIIFGVIILGVNVLFNNPTWKP